MQRLDKCLNSLSILRIEVKSKRKVIVRLVDLPKLLVNFSHKHRNRRLLRHKALKFFQLRQSSIVMLKLHQSVSLLVLIQSIIDLEQLAIIEMLQRLLELALRGKRHAQERVQNGVPRIDRNRFLEVFSSPLVLLLLIEDVAQPPPRVVVPDVEVQSVLEALARLLEILVVDVLVPAQSVRVRAVRV